MDKMIGKTFGKWTVVQSSIAERRGRHWLCVCSCGHKKVMSTSLLNSGKSLGCRHCRTCVVVKPKLEIGDRFGKWTIDNFLPNRKPGHWYECTCDCGTKLQICYQYLNAKRTTMCRSCSDKATAERNRTTDCNSRHGMHKHKIYKVWTSMKHRCDNPKSRFYHRYGGRGIGYDPKWNTFDMFIKDMGLPPEDGLELDRIDNNGHYCKSNCRWVDHETNSNNRQRRAKTLIPLEGKEGERCGKWTLVEERPNGEKGRYWLCRCECGTERVIHLSILRRGDSSRCAECRTGESRASIFQHKR